MQNCYKNKPFRKAWQLLLLVAGIIFAGSFSSFAKSYDLPIQGNDAVRCGAGELTLEVEWSGATLDPQKVVWYTEPYYGTPIDTGLTYNTGYIEYTHTFFVDYIDDSGCSQCDRLMIRAVINDNVVNPQISYSSLTICNNNDQNFVPTIVGASSGTFTVNPPSGLSVNGSDGTFNPNGADPDSYTITFEPVEVIGCNSNPVSTTVTITQALADPEISYPLASYCSTADMVSVTKTAGADGGVYSAYPSGLAINASTGTITPANSATGSYIVSYTVPGVGGCAPVVGTTTVSISKLPTATIDYTADSYTQNQAEQTVIMSGTDNYQGGTFSSTEGLTINSSTGAINPSTSTAGDYTVTYTKAAVNPCSDNLIATTPVTIYSLPLATITGNADVCINGDEPNITFTGSNGVAPYTFTYTINDGFEQRITTTSENSINLLQSTITPGSFIYTLTSVTDANGSTRIISTDNTSTVTVNVPAVALFGYSGSPFCSNSTDPQPEYQNGGEAGTFTASPEGLVFANGEGINPGTIDLDASTPGTYTVTNTIASAGGCSPVIATSEVTITGLPDATFAYDDSPYCGGSGIAVPTVEDVGTFSCDNQFLTFEEGDGVAPGTINLVLTPVGTYTITNTILANDGCALVSHDATITINEAPSLANPGFYQICSGESTNISLASNPEGATFSWTIGAVSGGITGANSGSGSTIDQVLQNASNTVAGSVEYAITPTLGTGDCSEGAPTTITVMVNPLPAIPTANNVTITYDGDEKTASAASSTITATSEDAVIDWYTTQTGTESTTAPTGTDAGVYTAWAEARYASSGCKSTDRTLVTLTITKAELTVQDAVVSDHTYDGTTDASISGATLSGVVSGDEVSLGDATTGTFAQANVGTDISISTSMSISGTDAGNYSLTRPTLSGNIIEKPVIITPTAGQSKIYGASEPAFAYTNTALVGTHLITGALSRETGEDVGNYAYTLGTLTAGTNYSLSIVANPSTFEIKKATLTVTADNIVRGVDETSPAYSYTMDGFKNPQTEEDLRTASTLSGTVTYTDNADGSTEAGSYTITPVISDLAATNYTFTAATGTLTISNVVIESTEGTARAGYATLGAAYTAVNNGIHQGVITIHVYADTSESTTATLNASGTDSASYTSVTIIAENGVTISGSSPLMILGNQNQMD